LGSLGHASERVTFIRLCGDKSDLNLVLDEVNTGLGSLSITA
jgi:hypothetical protein